MAEDHARTIDQRLPTVRGLLHFGVHVSSSMRRRMVEDLDRYYPPVHNHAPEDSSDTPRVGDLCDHLTVASQGLKAKRRCCKCL